MTHIQILTMASQVGDSDSPTERFATLLRAAGAQIEVVSAATLRPATVMLWEDGAIELQSGSPPNAVAAALRAVVKNDDLGGIFLVNTPSGPRTLKLFAELGLAGAIEFGDLWRASRSADLPPPPVGPYGPPPPYGFIGRTEFIDATKCPLLWTQRAYSKCDSGRPPVPLVGLADYLARYDAFRRRRHDPAT